MSDAPLSARQSEPDAREQMLASITRLGGATCGYTIYPENWHGTRCDCKYGGPTNGLSEQTGCPELRDLHGLIAALTYEEYEGLMWLAAEKRLTSDDASDQPSDRSGDA